MNTVVHSFTHEQQRSGTKVYGYYSTGLQDQKSKAFWTSDGWIWQGPRIIPIMMLCWTFLASFWVQKSGQRWLILCLDKEFADKFRCGYMDKVSWRSGFFSKCLVTMIKNVQIRPNDCKFQNTVINRRLDPCLVKLGSPAGRSGVISVKNAQILRGRK